LIKPAVEQDNLVCNTKEKNAPGKERQISKSSQAVIMSIAYFSNALKNFSPAKLILMDTALFTSSEQLAKSHSNS